MPSTYSPLNIELPATGEQSGTWGNTTNTNLGTALEEAIVGSADVTFTNGNDTTVTLTDSNASQTARNLRLNLIGSSNAAQSLILGSGCQIEKLYLVNNTLGHDITVKNTTGTGIVVPAGKTMFVYNNGTNVVEAVNSAVTLDVTTLDATNIEVTNIKAKDGTASATIANSTGVMTVASSVLTTTDINGGTIDNTAIGASTPAAGTFTQVDIVAQGDLRLQDTTGGQFVALQAPGTIATSYTLTLPVDDGTNGQALITDGNGVLSWSTAAAGDVYGPASATDNAVARFDLTTGKIIQNSVVIIADTTGDMTGVGTLSSGAITTTGVLTLPAGTVSAPAITTTGDTNTGIFFPAADTIAFTEGGAEAMRITSAGDLLVGATATRTNIAGTAQNFLIEKTAPVFQALVANENASGGSFLSLCLSRGSTVGSNTIVQSEDQVGGLTFRGNDGTNFLNLASIVGNVDGTPGTNDMPGRLVFSTTADGSASPTERMRITNAGNVGIGTASPNARLNVVAAASTIGQVRIDGSGVGGLFAGMTAGSIGFLHSNTGTLAFGTSTSDNNLVERMRIDSSGNVGIGTSSPSNKLTVNNAAGGTGISLTGSGTATQYINIANTGGDLLMGLDNSGGGLTGTAYTSFIGSYTNTPFYLYSNSVVRVAITGAGNVGIGTSSPTFAAGGGLNVANGTFATMRARGGSSTGTDFAGGSDGKGYVYVRDNADLLVGTNNTERMRIDSAGNVGIGTSSPSTKLDVNGVLAGYGGNVTAPIATITGANAATNGGGNLRIFANTSAADNVGGSMVFGGYYSAQTNSVDYAEIAGRKQSGQTTGGYMVFSTRTDLSSVTERMRIDSSGRVIINSTTVASSTTAGLQLRFNGTEAGVSASHSGVANYPLYVGGDGSGASALYIDAVGNVGIATNTPTTFGTFAIRRGTTSIGNVTGSVSASFSDGVNDTLSISHDSALSRLTFSSLTFNSGTNERMRITSGGQLFINKTTNSADGKLEIAGNASNTNIFSSQGTTSSVDHIIFSNSNGTVGTIKTSASATSYNTSSDYRLKENIAPMTGALDKVAQLKPCTYTWKVDGSDGQGFIAHELQEIAPYAVTGKKDGEQMQGVDYGKITPLLTAALQEALAKIESLEARLAVLESK
jgi:hypothetical protein